MGVAGCGVREEGRREGGRKGGREGRGGRGRTFSATRMYLICTVRRGVVSSPRRAAGKGGGETYVVSPNIRFRKLPKPLTVLCANEPCGQFFRPSSHCTNQNKHRGREGRTALVW